MIESGHTRAAQRDCSLATMPGSPAGARELECLLQWTWHIALTTLDRLKREDIENYIRFSQRPPAAT
jgi:hypothetical protein